MTAVPSRTSAPASSAPGRPEAAAAVWPWREAPAVAAAAARASRKRLMISGALGLAASFGVAWLGHPTAAWVVRALAGTTLALGLLGPPAVRARAEALVAGFGVVVGTVVAYLVLAPMFYLVITPVGVGRRLLGTDALRRRREPARESYWEPRTRPSSPRRPF